MKILKALGNILFAFSVYLGSQFFYSMIYTAYLGIFGNFTNVEDLTAALIGATTLISLTSALFTITVFALWPLAFRRPILPFFSICKIPPVSVPILFFMGLSAAMVVNWLMTWIPFPEWAWQEYNTLMGESVLTEGIVTFLAVVILAPILEELVFRSVLLTQCSRFMPNLLALLLSSLVFGLIHGNLIQSTYAFLCGICLGWLYLRYRSTLANILFHIGFNLSSYVFAFIPKDNPGVYHTVSVILCVLFFLSCGYVFCTTKPSPNTDSAKAESGQ